MMLFFYFFFVSIVDWHNDTSTHVKELHFASFTFVFHANNFRLWKYMKILSLTTTHTIVIYCHRVITNFNICLPFVLCTLLPSSTFKWYPMKNETYEISFVLGIMILMYSEPTILMCVYLHMLPHSYTLYAILL